MAIPGIAFQESPAHSFEANGFWSRNVGVVITPANVICFSGGYSDIDYDWRWLICVRQSEWEIQDGTWEGSSPGVEVSESSYNSARIRWEGDLAQLEALRQEISNRHHILPRLFYFHYPQLRSTYGGPLISDPWYSVPLQEYAPLGFLPSTNPTADFLAAKDDPSVFSNPKVASWPLSVELVDRDIFWDADSPDFYRQFFEPHIDYLGQGGNRLPYPVIATGPWAGFGRQKSAQDAALVNVVADQLDPAWEPYPGYPWWPNGSNGFYDYIASVNDLEWESQAINKLAGTGESESAIRSGHVRVRGSNTGSTGASINALAEALSDALSHLNRYH